ncbi:MAG: hypothetical protein ACC662_02555 [Planctomycetota bacterium]
MSNLSERQRLVVTILVTLLFAGGLLALILKDRAEIDTVQEEITSLDQRIQVADIEIRKTNDRENEVLVFRAVENRELAVLPTRQRIASFHRNLSTFLASAGLRFQELPESEPKESGLAKGIFVTRSSLSFSGDSASTLKLINMMENDPRLVAVKGVKIDAGDTDRDDPTAPVIHDVELDIETYYYNPASTQTKRVHIPNAEARLQEPVVKEAIASFQPERPDTYVLRPATSRRDPLVDPREAAPQIDEEAMQEAWREQEGLVLEVEAQIDEINEKVEQEKALFIAGALFRRDRVQRQVDDLLNQVRASVAQLDQRKAVTIPELGQRLELVRQRLAELRGRRQPRQLTVPRTVAQKTLDEVQTAFDSGDYTEVQSLCSEWSQFLEGKQIDPDAVEVVEEIAALRPRAKKLSEFQSIRPRVTGTIVHPVDPARSVALVNGRPLHVGEALDERGDVQVARITRQAVVFRYKGEAITVGRRHGGSEDGPKSKPVTSGAVRPVRATVLPGR